MRGIKTYHTADEFFKIACSLGPCELVDGEIQLMEPAGGEHGEIALRIGGRLLVFVEEHDLGKAFAAETGYILQHAQKEGERDTVKGIDASFIRKERIPPEGITKKFIPFPPDLAVEVVSPGDTKREVAEKVQEYLDFGVPLVWVVRPTEKTVTVYRATGEVEVKGDGDLLSGEDVVPGFTLKVDGIFA
ncbi:Uma2 family endonuclease [Candidatus Poribacteria bacterium]|nr:Uma2 family endonuclease [Candidatus Poribacteria bacterium]